jgi:hypothetical protein
VTRRRREHLADIQAAASRLTPLAGFSTGPAATAPSLPLVPSPSRVTFTDHAAERAARYGIPYGDVADAVLEEHGRRQRNPGAGDWLVRKRRLRVIYNWPEGDDETTARVITVWLGE